MSGLEIPELLRGPWDHILIMAYGADLSFFEGTLWRQLAGRCRNRIILADGQHYLEKCVQYAHKEGLVNHLNQLYLAAGIFGPRAAHAKFILLTNHEQGRLLVGSGNLGWQGYTSGGEMFTLYEYNTSKHEDLSAFLTVRKLVNRLVSYQYIDIIAQRQLNLLWEQTPWLFPSPAATGHPVRHNLDRSFLDQLKDELGDAPVEELWVLTPFYDREAFALARLLETLQPQQTRLLLQPGKTSVDPYALQRVIDASPYPCDVYAFNAGREKPYVHAKYYLLKLADRALCLQGSPNLSQVAFLLHNPQGNVEMANLLTGARDAFDDLLQALDIDATPTRPSMLGLVYQDQKTSDGVGETWRLIGGEYWEKHLVLHFQGRLPDLQKAELMVAHNPFPLHIRKYENQLLELMITDDVVNLLSRPVPVRIRWRDGESNPIFVCNRAALKTALEIPPESEHLQHIGDLDLDDKEFEELLDDLNEALIIDRRSIWRLAEQKKKPINADDDRSLHLPYEEVDYRQLRRHPKIQQYLSASAKGQSYSHSRLQIILNAITAHFQAYESAPVALMQVADTDLEEGEGTPIEEPKSAIVEKQERTWSIQQRTSRILKQFIQRYLRGLYSPDFQDFVGSEVITKNYIIFHHLLWRLFSKDWVEPAFVLDALLKTWSFFWGQETQPGYFFQISPDEQIQAQQELEDRDNHVALIAAFYYCTEIAMQEHWEKHLFTLRDCWRFFLCQSPFPLLKALLTETQKYLAQLLPYNSPSVSVIVDQLTRLAQFETRRNFLRGLEASGSYPMDSFAFTKETIIARGTVDCLQVRVPEALSTEDAARTLLQEWMLAERLDYYRIQASKREDTLKTTHMIDYDTSQQKGRYWSSEQKRLVELGVIPLPTHPWDFPLAQMRDLAANI